MNSFLGENAVRPGRIQNERTGYKSNIRRPKILANGKLIIYLISLKKNSAINFTNLQ